MSYGDLITLIVPIPMNWLIVHPNDQALCLLIMNPKCMMSLSVLAIDFCVFVMMILRGNPNHPREEKNNQHIESARIKQHSI